MQKYKCVENTQVYDINIPDVECKGVENAQVYDINDPDKKNTRMLKTHKFKTSMTLVKKKYKDVENTQV